jgi:16S rRNA (uracil1498-N3)-methyltransferase
MHTFFMKNIPAAGGEAELDKRERDHLFKTLRCRVGETLKLCDGKGTVAVAEATAERTVKIVERFQAERSNIEVHLFTALPRNNKLDLLLKPVTEAGVVSITPLKCRYSVAEKDSVPERWYTLMEEACKQSGNPFMPEINPALSVKEAVEYCRNNNMQIFFGDQHGELLLPEKFPADGKLKLAWMVGPEGGFDENEQFLLGKSGCGITLGEYIFRLENAALAGIAYLYTTARVAKKIKP